MISFLDALSQYAVPHLDLHTLYFLSRCNKYMYREVWNNECVWKYQYKRDFLSKDIPDKDSRRSYIQNYFLLRIPPAQIYQIHLQIVMPEFFNWILSENPMKLPDEHIPSLLPQIPDSAKKGDIIHINEYGDYFGYYIFDGKSMQIMMDRMVPRGYYVGDRYLSNHWCSQYISDIMHINMQRYRTEIEKNIDMDSVYSSFEGYLGKFTIVFTVNICDANSYSSSDAYEEFMNLDDEDCIFHAVAAATVAFPQGNTDPYVIVYILQGDVV